jgi:hypothetical protein
MTLRLRHPRSDRLVGAGAFACVATLTALVATPTVSRASTAPGLGTAANFLVLAGTPAISSTGLTVINGNVGIAPAAAVNGFPPGTITGTQEKATTVATTAKTDLDTAYGVAASSPCNTDMTGKNLGGNTLTPGTYCQTTAPTLTGVLTLSGDGVFIFQAGSTLVTGPGAVVQLINGAQACNVFWQVGSAATLDTTTTFVGTVMAYSDFTMNDGVHLTGRALARTGQVTMIRDTIDPPATCTAATVPGPTTTPTPIPTATPTARTLPPPIPAAPPAGAMGGGQGFGAVLLLVGATLVTATIATGARSRRRRS